MVFLLTLFSCTKDYLVPIGPHIPVETENLEAKYVETSITGIYDPYWRESDYLKVDVQDLSKEHLYEEDGLLNMTGTYDGLSSFNRGDTVELILKAAYDAEYLFLLIEWTDSDVDASRASWFWNGDTDPLKPDSTNGWTSQRNDDMLSLAFEIENASGSQGTFKNVGCATACHNGEMRPLTGSIDIWTWSLALSEPLGLAFDMNTNEDSGLVYDGGQISFERNALLANATRSGPAYEWNGDVQEITQLNGNSVILDPAFFLINKTVFLGDASLGQNLYLHDKKGCYHCHGEDGNGQGEIDNAPAFTNPKRSRLSRQGIIEYAGSENHSGQSYFNRLVGQERDDVIARIRGFAGVPGYYLNIPEEDNVDILSMSNANVARIEPENIKHQLFLSRKLNTGNEDDVVFDISVNQTYPFGIALMDNDGKNHIGSSKELLVFMDQ